MDGGDDEQKNVRPGIGRDDPPNLSISLSGGKETKRDSPSNGERKGNTASVEPSIPTGPRECDVREAVVITEVRRIPATKSAETRSSEKVKSL